MIPPINPPMTMQENTTKELLEFAKKLGDVAEKPILSRFRSKLTVEDKADLSPVTIASQVRQSRGL